MPYFAKHACVYLALAQAYYFLITPDPQVYIALLAASARPELDSIVLKQALHRSLDGSLLVLVEQVNFAVEDAKGDC